MTLIAGIISRKINLSIPPSVKEEMRRVVSRNSGDVADVLGDSRSFFVKVKLENRDDSQIESVFNGDISLVAGEPLLEQKTVGNHRRQEDYAKFNRIDIEDRNLDAILGTARGVFCGLSYKIETRVLTLTTDKLGVRPFYYWISEDYVVFANALRILEGLTIVPKSMNLRGVTEIVGFGYPLADRTPYKDIFVLKPAEIVEIGETRLDRRQYWHWGKIDPSSESETKLLEELYATFSNAVAIRNQNDDSAIAYLSGGLDSRCVVAALRSAKVRVHTFNFARAGTQDAAFGNEFAALSKTVHEHIPKDAGDLVPDYSTKMADAWRRSVARNAWQVERPSYVWSGEGGSVALGHVHMNEEIVRLMRTGQIEGAIEAFLRREQIALPLRLLTPKASQQSSQLLNVGIREELELLNSVDPGRRFYLFLMLNDQRRKLFAHFENIDLHRLEFHLPFFDSCFLNTVIAVPLDLCLRHKFYVRWLQYFDASVKGVTWQVYPEHEPCPIPPPSGLSYQWAGSYQHAERSTKRRQLLKKARKLIAAPDFPDELLSKWILRLSAAIHATGFRDYEYIIEGAETYHTYWRRCHGNLKD
jgi:asparagine synthase (glutamine-hydrolysing)